MGYCIFVSTKLKPSPTNNAAVYVCSVTSSLPIEPLTLLTHYTDLHF